MSATTRPVSPALLDEAPLAPLLRRRPHVEVLAAYRTLLGITDRAPAVRWERLWPRGDEGGWRAGWLRRWRARWPR